MMVDAAPRPRLEFRAVKVAVPKETAAGERRVALVPDTVARLAGSGLEIAVESGAGEGAWFSR